MAMTPQRIAEIDAMVADVTARAKPILAAASPNTRAALMKEMEAGLERTYAVMLGQSGPESEEAILIVEKIRGALMAISATS